MPKRVPHRSGNWAEQAGKTERKNAKSETPTPRGKLACQG